MYAIITADIVDYTLLSKEGEDKVLQTIRSLFGNDNSARHNIDSNYSIKRGDNIQIELKEPSIALETALLLKTAINKINLNDESSKPHPKIDARIAIGIGAITSKRESVDESTGDAYTYSGRTLDMMKKEKRILAFNSAVEHVNAELETEFKLLEVIMTGWSRYSAEVIYYTLLGLTQTEIGKKINKSQPAIYQRTKIAGWSGIRPLLKRFETITKTTFL